MRYDQPPLSCMVVPGAYCQKDPIVTKVLCHNSLENYALFVTYRALQLLKFMRYRRLIDLCYSSQCTSSISAATEGVELQTVALEEISGAGSAENNKKEAPEVKRKNVKRTFKSEKGHFGVHFEV
ncbi:UNVERIFIED_CONTAM: hypothetical protein Sradi_6181300 [Sesamum radiatum]|uniref:Uncharacterized protein n=1 Tax=Sesamum radiatum TaxID=300843 RepID=A0AAW2K957_SESRA